PCSGPAPRFPIAYAALTLLRHLVAGCSDLVSAMSDMVLPSVVDWTRPPDPGVDASRLRRIAAIAGKSYGQIVLDYASLAFGPGRLSFSEYVALRLFDERQ